MRTVLTISDSVENSEYDLNRSIRTIKDYGLDPLAVVPRIYFSDGKNESNDVAEMIDYVFGECDNSVVSIGYMTDPDVISYLSGKLDRSSPIPVVSAPSIISDKGNILVSEEVYNAVCSALLPKVGSVIINNFEAELLAGFECRMNTDIQRAAKKIYNVYGCGVMIKGCPLTEERTLAFDGTTVSWIDKPKNVEGSDPTQYMLLTAVACSLAYGHDMITSAKLGLDFCSGRTDIDWATGNEIKKEESKTVSRPVAALSSSLVSPGKSLRDIARNFPLDIEVQPSEKESVAVTSAIEPPKKDVPTLTTPSLKLGNDSLAQLQSMKDRLNRLNKLAGAGD